MIACDNGNSRNHSEDNMNHLSLFSGIGGFDLAAEWAGFTTIAFCEKDPYCQKVLAKHWQGVPIYDDIRELTAARLVADGIGPIDLITGGFPCQPFSIAGKRKGAADDRHLWPEMLRVIQEVKPTWIVGENVAGFIAMALDSVLSDLEAEGYETQTLVLPACAVSAPHRRDRAFIVAHTDGRRSGCEGGNAVHKGRAAGKGRATRIPQATGWQDGTPDRDTQPAGADVPDTDRRRCRQRDTQQRRIPELDPRGDADGAKQWQAEPGICRVVDGLPNRVDRLRSLGNAVVPQVVYPILQAIADEIKKN
jgi:DNA (cytosine-5)-methyltransferase 1